METKPSKLLIRIVKKLFESSSDQEVFVTAITSPQQFDPCLVWMKTPPSPLAGERPKEVPAGGKGEGEVFFDFVDRVPHDSQPGKNILHDQGFYYCMDFSSVFMASVIKGIEEKIETILDLCSAPGGKGIISWRYFNPKELVCNEVMKKRLPQLMANLKRCQIQPVKIISSDPQHLTKIYSSHFDLVIVDAPCSGQALLAKGKRADGCFHPVLIKKNAMRQRRILACASQLVIPGGYLAYMTCTYSKEENEDQIAWFCKKFPDMVPISVNSLEKFQSHLSKNPCYRLWPQQKLGAGGFTCLFKKQVTISKDHQSHYQMR